MGAWPVLLSALGKPVTLAALEILVLTVQKLGATHNHTRGWLPATGSCAVPGSPPNKGLSTDTAAAGCRIVCQPSLINTTFSIQVLGLSRGLRCPGKTRKLLISRTGSVISEFSWIQMCQLQPSPLELLGAGRSAMHHFFFFYLPGSWNGKKVCGVPALHQAQGSCATLQKEWLNSGRGEEKWLKAALKAQSHRAFGELVIARFIPPGGICHSSSFTQNESHT